MHRALHAQFARDIFVLCTRHAAIEKNDFAANRGEHPACTIQLCASTYEHIHAGTTLVAWWGANKLRKPAPLNCVCVRARTIELEHEN